MGAERRVALLVGINNYWFGGWQPLQFAESDCQKLAKALCQPQYGFSRENIHILTGSATDLSKQPFRNNFLYGNLFSKIGSEPMDLFVFFFAGHGEEFGGQSYLVPVDGVRERVAETCVPLSFIVERVSALPARQKLMIFDICHSAGVRGEAPGLPPSFAKEAEQVYGAVVLSACDVGEFSHEDPELKGGVFTHYWCEALWNASPPPPDFSVFDAQKYAEQKVREWAKRNRVTQNPQIWAARTPTVYLVPGELPTFPSFLSDAVSRTATIVRVVRSILEGQIPADYCVRIHAFTSSFAISENEPLEYRTPQLHELHALLIEERDSLIELFRKGAHLKVILSWSLEAYLKRLDASGERITARLLQLRSFCREILANEDSIARATFVHIPTPERNILILGNDYFFEGRKLKVRGSFDATQLITDPEVIQREIVMFDALFEDAINYVCRTQDLPRGKTLNERLLKALVRDINRDLSRLSRQARKGGD